MYPYPNIESYFPGGIWYSLPGEANCQPGPPTGAANCTYSYLTWPEEEITLEELQGAAGRSFWDSPSDVTANAAKVDAAAQAFRKKYPDTEDLETPSCDFNFERFWS